MLGRKITQDKQSNTKSVLSHRGLREGFPGEVVWYLSRHRRVGRCRRAIPWQSIPCRDLRWAEPQGAGLRGRAQR